jgi:hypothetical protein
LIDRAEVAGGDEFEGLAEHEVVPVLAGLRELAPHEFLDRPVKRLDDRRAALVTVFVGITVESGHCVHLERSAPAGGAVRVPASLNKAIWAVNRGTGFSYAIVLQSKIAAPQQPESR